MKCEILFFAQVREAVGIDRVILDLAERATVADALDALTRLHQPIQTLQQTLAVAVDQIYRRPDFVLHDGCTIALIPPVSGG